MIEAGFHLNVAGVVGSDSYLPESNKHVQCQVYLVQTKGGKSGVITLTPSATVAASLDESVDLMMQAEEMEERDVNGFIAFDEDTGKLESASFSLDKIAAVDEMEEDEDADAGVTMELKIKGEVYLLSIRTCDQDEGSALSMGLQMLVARERTQLRKRPSRNR